MTLVALLFALATVVAWISAVSLLAPGGPLEPMWRLNPDARAGFSSLGRWAPALLVLLGCATGAAAVGLWRLRRWGRWLAVSLLALDALGGVVRAIRDPRSALGLVVVAALLALLLSRRARAVLSR